MKEILFYFLVLLCFNFSHQIKEIDYYAYIIPGTNMIICSDKIEIKSNLILNEFQNDYGFTCLLNLNSNGFYKVNFTLNKLENDQKMFSSSSLPGEHSSKNLLDITIGNNKLFYDIDLIAFNTKTNNSLKFWIKLNNNKVSLIKNSDCNYEEIENCQTIDASDSLFMKKFIKINFELRQPNFQEIILLEKEMTSKLLAKSDDCDPPCVNGACNEGECLCQFEYMGINCSIKLQAKEFRLGIPLLIIFFIGAIISGIICMWGMHYSYLAVFKENELKENSKEVDIMEHWAKIPAKP